MTEQLNINVRHICDTRKQKRWVEVFAGGRKIAAIYCKPSGERVVYHPLAPTPRQSSLNGYGGSKAHATLGHSLLSAAKDMPTGPRQALKDPVLTDVARHIYGHLCQRQKRT